MSFAGDFQDQLDRLLEEAREFDLELVVECGDAYGGRSKITLVPGDTIRFHDPEIKKPVDAADTDSTISNPSPQQEQKTKKFLLLMVEMGHPFNVREFSSDEARDDYLLAYSDGTNYECTGRQCVPVEAALKEKDWYDDEFKVDYMPEWEVFKQRVEKFLAKR